MAIKIAQLKDTLRQNCSIEAYSAENARRVMAFHQSFPGYAPTPLAKLSALAERLGVSSICVKDESKRFGLNAFKALGGSYAMGRYISRKLGLEAMDYAALTGEENRAKLGPQTFITATDGNHGRGIAWTASRIGQKCIVYMPAGTAAERLENIRRLGADASITELNYDGCVARAYAEARQYGYILMQDTAFEGYETIPQWIMQGYMTMAAEATEQLDSEPTHIFLQAGVGSMAAAVAAYFVNVCKNKPVITIAEPDKADCFYRSAEANNGQPRSVGGAMDTIMAGLACGVPCSLAWDILRDYADFYVSMPDYVAANGMRILANPLEGDPHVISGESGASTTGLVCELLMNPEMKAVRQQIGLNKNSRILCFSTEGDTDKENYRRVLWNGAYPSP